MADSLATLSTETLTAAVTSLLQKPLPESYILPTHSASAAVIQSRNAASHHHVASSPRPPSSSHAVVSPTNSVPLYLHQHIRHLGPPSDAGNQQNISSSQPGTQLSTKQLLETLMQQHVPIPSCQNINQNVQHQDASKLKFSVDNIHLAPTHTPENRITRPEPQPQPVISNTNLVHPSVIDLSPLPNLTNTAPLPALPNSLSVLQSLLNAQLQNHTNTGVAPTSMLSEPSNSNANLIPPPNDINSSSFLSQFSPTQPLQNLIQTLFPQFDQSAATSQSTLANQNQTKPSGLNSTVAPTLQTSPLLTQLIQDREKIVEPSVMFPNPSESINKPQTIINNSSATNFSKALNHAAHIESSQQNYSDALEGTITTGDNTNIGNQIINKSAELQSPSTEGSVSTIQQFPILVQPSSTAGGPLQLIPLGPGIDWSTLQHLQQQVAKTSDVSLLPSSSVPFLQPPVNIQPKPPLHPMSAVPDHNQQTMKPNTICTPVGSTPVYNTPVPSTSALVASTPVYNTPVASTPVHNTSALSAPALIASSPVYNIPALVQPGHLDMNLLQQILNQQLAANKDITTLPRPLPIMQDSTAQPLYGATKSCDNIAATVPVQPYPTHPNGADNYLVQSTSHTAEPQVPINTHNDCQFTARSLNTSNESQSAKRAEEVLNMDDTCEMSEAAQPEDCVTMDTEVADEQQQEEIQHVFCVDCNKFVVENCRVHSTDYMHVLDTPILSRARASLPSVFYIQQTSAMEIKDLLVPGIWCKDCVSERSMFGPIIGERKIVKTTDFTQQINGFNPFKIGMSIEGTEILDMTDETQCNWMMFIRMAHSLMEQNCTMYLQKGEFYVVTKTEIKEDEELLLWFSAEMCEQMGISQNPGIVKLLPCGVCTKYFTTKKFLNSHIRTAHPDSYHWSYPCPICGKKFNANSKLNSHMMSHMGMKPHGCPFCGKQFSDPSNLKTHMHIHTGEKKFQCTKCDKKFRQKAHLDMHLVTHTGDKKYTCSYCMKSFARHSDLKTHTYRHTQELQYRCATCNKVFYKTQNYKKHLKVHTGERNYMCNKCFKGFQTKYHRDRHLKICKEKNGKEVSYMSLEEVAKLDNTCDDVVPLKTVT